MKKTLSVNIKGTNFLFEEDAYELLKDYLKRLEMVLSNESGCQEIIEDVEIRIAEICSSKLFDSKEVIELADIQEILEKLGDPSAYLGDEDPDFDEESSNKSRTSSTSADDEQRRLFRDTENGIIGGVCQGLAAFFNIDVVVIRAIFIVILLFVGFGLPLYLILWIIVPRAKNTIDRLRMKGRPITVENVKDEVENAAERVKEGSKRFANRVRNNNRYSKVISGAGRILSVICGVFFIGWGLTWLIGFILLVVSRLEFIPIQSDQGWLSIWEVSQLVIPSDVNPSTLWTGVYLLTGSAILFLLLLGVMILARHYTRWAKRSLLALFLSAIVGVITCAYVGISTGRDFVASGDLKGDVGTVYSEQLTIIPTSKRTTENGFEVMSDDGFMSISKNKIRFSEVSVQYRKSADTLFHISQYKESQGRNATESVDRAQAITHTAILNGDTLIMDPWFEFPRKDKIRAQEVTIVIEIPEGATVRIKDDIISLDNAPRHPSHHRVRSHGFRDKAPQWGRLQSDGDYYHYD